MRNMRNAKNAKYSEGNLSHISRFAFFAGMRKNQPARKVFQKKQNARSENQSVLPDNRRDVARSWPGEPTMMIDSLETIMSVAIYGWYQLANRSMRDIVVTRWTLVPFALVLEPQKPG